MKNLTIHILSIEFCRLITTILEHSITGNNALGYCYNVADSIYVAKQPRTQAVNHEFITLRDKQMSFNNNANYLIFPYQVFPQLTADSATYLIKSPLDIDPIVLINKAQKMLPMYNVDIIQSIDRLVIIAINKRLIVRIATLNKEEISLEIALKK